MTQRYSRIAIAVVAASTLTGAPDAHADFTWSGWSEGQANTRARLLGGGQATGGSQPGAIIAAVEIQMAEGWKTYWRFPGDAGGVPPTFDWGKSENVASATVLYPAPKRLSDKAGDTLGYKGVVIFPVEISAKDPTKPIVLKLTLDYGICREICIPVEAELMVDVPPGQGAPLPAEVLTAIEKVPRTATHRATDPRLVKSEVKLSGSKPSITLEAEFPGGTGHADLFIEGPEGTYIPLPKGGVDAGRDRLRYEIDLTGAVDPADVRGKLATITLVSDHGQSQTTLKLE